jgi:hypothetical protein
MQAGRGDDTFIGTAGAHVDGVASCARALVSSNTSLTSLDLSGHLVSPAAAAALAALLSGHAHLQQLRLTDTGLKNEQLVAICGALPSAPALTSLALGKAGPVGLSGARALSAALQAPSGKLQQLDLSFCTITADADEAAAVWSVLAGGLACWARSRGAKHGAAGCGGGLYGGQQQQPGQEGASAPSSRATTPHGTPAAAAGGQQHCAGLRKSATFSDGGHGEEAVPPTTSSSSRRSVAGAHMPSMGEEEEGGGQEAASPRGMQSMAPTAAGVRRRSQVHCSSRLGSRQTASLELDRGSSLPAELAGWNLRGRSSSHHLRHSCGGCRLTHLNLSHCGLTTTGAESLAAALASNVALTHLDLAGFSADAAHAVFGKLLGRCRAAAMLQAGLVAPEAGGPGPGSSPSPRQRASFDISVRTGSAISVQQPVGAGLRVLNVTGPSYTVMNLLEGLPVPRAAATGGTSTAAAAAAGAGAGEEAQQQQEQQQQQKPP